MSKRPGTSMLPIVPRPGPVLLAVLLVVPLWAEAGPEPVQGVPTLPPTPRTTPMVPGGRNETALSPATRLQRRLEQLVREREERISALISAGTQASGPARLEDPALEEPLRAREGAWKELRQALADFVGRNPTARKDLLATRPRQDPALAQPLGAQNRLAVAECYKDLASGSEGTLKDVDDGLATLADLDRSALAEADRILAAYLLVWFHAERTRLLPAGEAEGRRRSTAAAASALAELRALAPEGELALAAGALVSSLALEPAAPATAGSPR